MKIKLLFSTIALLLVTVSPALAQKPTMAAKPEKYDIDNCVTNFDIEKIDSTKSGYAFWFIKKGFAQSPVNVKMSYVDRATATHPPHTHANEEYFYILEGNAIVHIDGGEKLVTPNTVIYCPGGVPHGIRRADDKPIRYLVVNN